MIYQQPKELEDHTQLGKHVHYLLVKQVSMMGHLIRERNYVFVTWSGHTECLGKVRS
jgi:hypothetical protein